jgi:WD40 repeat protein
MGLGLLRLVECWRSAVAAGNPGTAWQRIARTSLSAWQRHHPKLQAVFSHGAKVLSVAFSPDGTTVITASYDGTARLWDASTGRQLGHPLTHQDAVRAVAFSPDGTTVITGSEDNTARLWDVSTRRQLGRPLTHQGVVMAVAFSPDGKTILTGCSDEKARLWDVSMGRPIGQPLTHQGAVSAVAFSRGGKTVITGSWDRTARFWDVATEPLPDDLERVANWVEVLTGLTLDEDGSVQILDNEAWLRGREKVEQQGGPPVADAVR